MSEARTDVGGSLPRTRRGACQARTDVGPWAGVWSLALLALLASVATGCSARPRVVALPQEETTPSGETGEPVPGTAPGRTGQDDRSGPEPDPDGLVVAPGEPAASRPFVHVVRPGETLWRIARRYGVDLHELARANGISDPTRIDAGRELVISVAARGGSAPRAEEPPAAEPIRSAAARFAWPVRGRVSSGFGARRGSRRHQGIDILVPTGTPIIATSDGVVRFAGWRGNYGNLVILDHGDGFTSYYAHNRSVRVDRGDEVERGEEIASSGRTGNASAPHLHFELRRHGRPLDPLTHLGD